MRTHRASIPRALLATLALALAVAPSCGGDDDDDPLNENTGESCVDPAGCYELVDHADIQGEVQCLERVEFGYCTHFCESDANCCAVPGECEGNRRQLCAPFESTGNQYCFLSCEPADIGDLEENDYCQTFVHPSFGCRSTGGGSANRKVCVP